MLCKNEIVAATMRYFDKDLPLVRSHTLFSLSLYPTHTFDRGVEMIQVSNIYD